MAFPAGVYKNQANIGTTVRPSSTALLAIDSDDRFKNYTERRNAISAVLAGSNVTTYSNYNWNPFDFTISKNQALMNGFFTRLGVSEVVFPNGSLPNIGPKTRQMIVQYKVGGVGAAVVQAILIPEGFYPPFALAAYLQATIVAYDATLAGFTMVYGTQGNPTFLYATGSTTTIAFNPVVTEDATYPYPDTTRQLFDLLGMSAVNNLFVVSGSTGQTYCQGTRYVDIVCSQLTYNQDLKDTMSQVVSRDSLCRVYMNSDPLENGNKVTSPFVTGYAPMGTYPTTIYRNFAQSKQIQWIPNQAVAGALSFQVYDDNGDLLTPTTTTNIPCMPDLNWSMSILVSEN